MYCPNCGTSNIEPDSNFCPECGAQISNLQTQSSTNQSSTTQTYVQQPIRQQPSLNVAYYPQRSSEISAESKRALGFSIASLGLVVAGLLLGGGALFYTLITRSSYYGYPYYSYPYGSYSYMSPSTIMAGLIPAIALNGLGLIFGIIARVNASRASSEDNAARKVGGVFSVLGIVFNCIAIGVAVLLGPYFIYIFSYSPYTYPYYYYP
ncbi:MAG: zinc ribbon domain-containing protein [Promethearchaeota archaeon]